MPPQAPLRHHRSWVDKFSKPSNTKHSFQLINLLNAPQESVQKHLSNISNLLNDDIEKKEFRAHGVIPVVIHVMSVNHSNRVIQITGTSILTLLAGDDDVAAEIAQREGVQALIDILISHIHDAEVCKAAITALRVLTYVTENRVIMLQYDVLPHLIDIMDKYISDEQLAEFIPGTVANIVYGSDQSREKAGRLGGIKCFTKGILVHSLSTNVIAQCAFGIRNLVWECSHNIVSVMENHTVDALLHAISTHRECLEVVTQILGAFANMVSSDATIRARLVNEKPFFVDLFHIMSTFVEESNLCATACFVIIALAEHDIPYGRVYARAIATHCKDANAYPAIVSGLENAIRSKNDDAVAKFNQLIHVLNPSEEFRRDMTRANALEVLIKALREQTFHDELPIAKLLCGIRCVICGNDEGKLKFKQLGGFPVIVEVLKANMKSYMVILKCTQVLDNAADGQIQTSEHLLDHKEEAIQPLLAAMSDFTDSAELQVNVCTILVKIATISSEEAAKLVEAGARPFVEFAKSRHKGNPAVESLAAQLLSLLEDKSSEREGRGNARGNASSRLRSRSRTIQAGSRSRSRAEKSKSVDRMMKQARRALEAAKMKQGGNDQESKDLHRTNTAPAVGHVKRSTRNKPNLEPLYE